MGFPCILTSIMLCVTAPAMSQDRVYITDNKHGATHVVYLVHERINADITVFIAGDHTTPDTYRDGTWILTRNRSEADLLVYLTRRPTEQGRRVVKTYVYFGDDNYIRLNPGQLKRYRELFVRGRKI